MSYYVYKGVWSVLEVYWGLSEEAKKVYLFGKISLPTFTGNRFCNYFQTELCIFSFLATDPISLLVIVF